jgi:hypothetical protein
MLSLLSARTLIAFALLFSTIHDVGAQEFCHGCSCKCGPGFKLPNGLCASWVEHWRYTAKGGYPLGTSDEVWTADKNPSCPPEAIIEKRKSR